MTDMPLSKLASFFVTERHVGDRTPASRPFPERIIAALFSWRPSLSGLILRYVKKGWHGAALNV